MASMESYRVSTLAQVISMKKNTAIVIILILSLFCSGCRLGYIFHAATNQFRLIRDSVEVEDALNNDLLESDHRNRIRLVASVKDFGERELGLKKTENYQTVYLKSDQPPLYTVSACPKDRLERVLWWFPIVGNMPYLGFFNTEEAKKEKARLVKKDLDVSIGVAEAYSTLGWFKDPLTLNLLNRSTAELTETILHEMTHTTIYLKGQGEFNEGLANLVGKVGAVYFLETTLGRSHPFTVEAENVLADERLFSSFISSLFDRLEELYGSDMTYEEKLEEREKIFTMSLKEYKRIEEGFKSDRFKGFGEYGLNNAYIMAIGLYHRHFNLFETVLKENNNSIQDMLIYYKKMADKDGDMMEQLKALYQAAAP